MANKYTGEKCFVCGELFEDDQDIVVCPDCGTPYHRKCWELKGECINTVLHENGQSWTASNQISYTPAPEGEPIKCIRCGKENPAGQKFCAECGLPLNFSREEPRPFNEPDEGSDADKQNGEFTPYTPSQGDPFNNISMQTIKLTPQSDMNGIKLGDFITYIGNRSLSIITSFIKFAKTGQRLSLNVGALFIPNLYFFYRKMYKAGIVYMILNLLLSIPEIIYYGQSGDVNGMILFTTPLDLNGADFRTLTSVCYIAEIAVNLFAGVYANYWYYKKARNEIEDIRANSTAGENETEVIIRMKGGTSKGAFVLSFAISMILQLALMIGLSIVYPVLK
ncbi:MAG: DUF2628 domain-containing protein [Ruminococcus sp.]|nr:DUF2628 domain-containing protein [Ruminococcus sp.]